MVWLKVLTMSPGLNHGKNTYFEQVKFNVKPSMKRCYVLFWCKHFNENHLFLLLLLKQMILIISPFYFQLSQPYFLFSLNLIGNRPKKLISLSTSEKKGFDRGNCKLLIYANEIKEMHSCVFISGSRLWGESDVYIRFYLL